VMGASGRLKITTESLVEAAAIPNVSAYLVRGVDISHYQGDVDWRTVGADGLSFVYIKATEGGDGVDDKFAANWEGARTAGLARGAYHFYNFCKTGAEQAANFVKAVPADPDALPATIDLEESGDCKKMPAKAAFRKNLAAFVTKIRAAYGRAPVLYINYAIYDLYFKGENDSYKLWIADINHAAPSLPDNAPWTMWQYGWHGSVAGIQGEVDLDVLNGTTQTLASLEGPGDVMVASLDPR
jgi:lysozyme